MTTLLKFLLQLHRITTLYLFNWPETNILLCFRRYLLQWIQLDCLINFTNKRMFFWAIYVSPRPVAVRVLQQETVLVTPHVVWLPWLPVAIGNGIWSSGVRPFKDSLSSVVWTTGEKSCFSRSRQVCWRNHLMKHLNF